MRMSSAKGTGRILSVQPVAEAGGSDQALLRMLRHLAATGWDCHVVLPGRGPLDAAFAEAGVTLHVVAMRRISTSNSLLDWGRYALAWPVSVARLAAVGHRVDAQVLHSNSLHTWYGWAAAALLRRPHLWHAREIVVQSSAALVVERFLLHHFADQVVAMSEAIAAQFDPGNVIVVRDDPDPAEVDPARAGRFRASVGVADDAPLVGGACRIDTWKGVDVLLDAVEPLRRRRPDAQVVIAGATVTGKEDYSARLQAQAAALPEVFWLGQRNDIAELMADLDVFVQASTQPEPFGLVLVEAMASGAPVVATAAGGPIEILAGAAPNEGRLVPIGDPEALAEAIADLLPASSSAEQRRARPRLHQSPLPQWGALFTDLVARGRTGPLNRLRTRRVR
jgi:glycosyltransferase involved in cell wall biosynthesis